MESSHPPESAGSATALPLLLQNPSAAGPGLLLGAVAPEFPPLPGIDGRRYSLGSFADRAVLVIAFLGDACPAAKACLPELVDLQKRWAPSGVQVVGINSNNPYLSPTDTLESMTLWAAERHVNFPYLKDEDATVAGMFGATNTPHFLVLDRNRVLRYRGRMFDSREPARATRRDVEEVVQALANGKDVPPHETPALGCSLVR